VPYTISRLLPTPNNNNNNNNNHESIPHHFDPAAAFTSVFNKPTSNPNHHVNHYPGLHPTSLNDEFAAAAINNGAPFVMPPHFVDPTNPNQLPQPYHGTFPMPTGSAPTITPQNVTSSRSSRALGSNAPAFGAPPASTFKFDYAAAHPNTVPFDPYNPSSFHPMYYHMQHQYHHHPGMHMHHYAHPMAPYPTQQLHPYAQAFTVPPPAAPAPAPAPSAPALAPPTLPKENSDTNPLFPNASLPGSHSKMSRTTNEIIRCNIRLRRDQRGLPGSKEYMANQEVITKAPSSKFRLQYVDIDSLTDPTREVVITTWRCYS
jgi:hypothetical protein